MFWYTTYDPLAQSVEHLTFNQGVRGSSLRWVTKIREGIALAMPSLILTIRYVTLNPAKSQDFAKRAHSDLEQQFPSAHAGVQSLRWGLGFFEPRLRFPRSPQSRKTLHSERTVIFGMSFSLARTGVQHLRWGLG